MRVSHPNLFTQYWNARSIKKSACNKIMLKGKVYDSVTHQPLPGAKLTFTLDSNSTSLASGADLVKNIRVKAAGGGFNLKNIPDGGYLVIVKCPGYEDRQLQSYVNNGVLTVVQLPLNRIE